MALLKSACGCCSVTVGAKVLAWIDIVFSFLQILGSFEQPPLETVKPLYEDGPMAQITRYQETIDTPMAVIPASLVMILCGVLLLVGIEKRNKAFVIPHLIAKAIGMTFIAFLLFVSVVLTFVFNGDYFMFALIFAASLALQLYFWLWVYSVYQEIRESENGAASYVYPQGKV